MQPDLNERCFGVSDMWGVARYDKLYPGRSHSHTLNVNSLGSLDWQQASFLKSVSFPMLEKWQVFHEVSQTVESGKWLLTYGVAGWTAGVGSPVERVDTKMSAVPAKSFLLIAI